MNNYTKTSVLIKIIQVSIILITSLLMLNTSNSAFADSNNSNKIFRVIVLGDTDYLETDHSAPNTNEGFGGYGGDATITTMFVDINHINDVDLLVHVGDIFGNDAANGGPACITSTYQNRLARLNNFRAPLIYALGDNEWTDCANESPTAGAFSAPLPLREPLDALKEVRNIFHSNKYSLGGNPALKGKKVVLIRQSDGKEPNDPLAKYSENTMYIHKGVLFASISTAGPLDNCLIQTIPAGNTTQNFWDDLVNTKQTLVSGNGTHLVATAADVTNVRNGIFGNPVNVTVSPNCSAEFNERRAANIAWIHEAFEKAKEEKVRGVVILSQAQMSFQTFLSAQDPNFGGFSSWNVPLSVFSTNSSVAISQCTSSHFAGVVNGTNCTITLPRDVCLPAGSPLPYGGTMSVNNAQSCMVFDSLRRVLHDEAASFGKPVAILSGDSHFYRKLKPFTDVPNLVSIQNVGIPAPGAISGTTFYGTWAGWVNMLITPSDKKVFTFSTGNCYPAPQSFNPLSFPTCRGAGGLLRVTQPSSAALELDIRETAISKPIESVPGRMLEGELQYINNSGCTVYPANGSASGKIVLINSTAACNTDAEIANAAANGVKALIIGDRIGGIVSPYIPTGIGQNQISVFTTTALSKSKLVYILSNNEAPVIVRLETGVGVDSSSN